uniref:Sortilin-related receptor n=1 Tax=Culicoides sonorensis TaxID=179676 RepID=A0A336LRR7_CULSO
MKRYCIFLLVFYQILLTYHNVCSEQFLFLTKDPDIYTRKPSSVINNLSLKNFISDEDDKISSILERSKRDTKNNIPFSLDNSQGKNISTIVNRLNDSHAQLMVHWLGEGTDVIICLAREPPLGILDDPKKLPAPSPSSVFLSYDYGDTFQDKSDLFNITINGTSIRSTVDEFITHLKFNTIVFTDARNKAIFSSADYGRTFQSSLLDFKPSDVTFYEQDARTFLALDKEDPERKLYYTTDLGKSFNLLQSRVKSFVWSSIEGYPVHLYVERTEPTNTSSIIFLDAANLLKPGNKNKKFNLLIENVQEFFIKKDFMFATQKILEDTKVLISYRRGRFVKATFQTELDIKGIHVADVDGKRILLSVMHTEKISHLYVSESNADMSEIKFVPSLENIFSYLPNQNWRSSWLVQTSDEAFTDLYKVEGLQGIYIASKIQKMPTSELISPDHLGSVITFDHGSTWRAIHAPTVDDEGIKIQCKDCSLHLSQKFSQLYPVTRSVSIMSSKSAPGVIMASGVIGKSLKGHPGVFISRDAGLTWKQILKNYYFFNMGDHGGVLVAVKYFKSKGETNEILYSTDEGETWIPHPFHANDLKVYGLMTEPNTNTTMFTLFGSEVSEHKWLIIKIDLKNAFSANCTEDDYKFWAPGLYSDGSLMPCLLGQRLTYQRRKPHAQCHNGLNYERPYKTEICGCNKWDFECDYGFTRPSSSSHCVRNKTIPNFDPFEPPKTCKPGRFYNRTKGYRKIEGDVCIDGFANPYLPQEIPCPIKFDKEFLIVAQRDKISSIDLSTNSAEILPIKGVKNVIAIDFDRKHNCVFWADILSDTIGRQCLNGNESAEILVETGLGSVEGMSYDWTSELLYYVDGLSDGTDEICDNKTSVTCKPDEFRCNSTGSCIPEQWRCDLDNDCQNQQCSPGEFRCLSDGLCLPLSKYCDKIIHCADGSDENCQFPVYPAKSNNCENNPGMFICDDTCLPLMKKCDGKVDCIISGEDEDKQMCSKFQRVYQVIQIGVDERTLNATSFLIYWWIPVPANITFEYMPSIYVKGQWQNNTNWIETATDFRFTKLMPYTVYNVTVYVRIKGSKTVFPPHLFYEVATSEGIPTPPLNVSVQQINGSRVQVSWVPPKNINGHLEDYFIFYRAQVAKTSNAASIRVGALENSTIIESEFKDGVVYEFWVKVKNRRFSSAPSEHVTLKFDGTANIDAITNLKIVSQKEDSITLTWDNIKRAEGYIIQPILPQPYPRIEPFKTKDTKIQIEKLVPGVQYVLKVSGYIKQYVGRPATLIFTVPKSEPLPVVKNVNVTKIGDIIKVSWDKVTHTKYTNFVYGIYYGPNLDELAERPRLKTTNTNIEIKDMKPCESYMISVNIIEPYGPGPLSDPKTIATGFKLTEPPRNLQVDIKGQNMIITWEPSCPLLTNANLVEYMITIREHILNKTNHVTVQPTPNRTLVHNFAGIPKGSHYTVTVAINTDKAKPAVAEVSADPLPAPTQLRVWPEKNGSYSVHWKELDFHDEKHKYEAVVFEGMGINGTEIAVIEAKNAPVQIHQSHLGGSKAAGKVFTVGVRMRTERGFISGIDNIEYISVQPDGLHPDNYKQSGFSWWWLILGGILIASLISTVVFLVQRQRRLQSSFSRFVNGHYDTKTGATRFFEDDHHETATTFADDEPLVVT